jgi:sulfite dehydrogenase
LLDLGIKPSRWLPLSALAFGAAAAASGGNEAGKQLFVKEAMPPCAICHVLADAGASGAVGPSLDELKPDVPRVVKAVKGGFGAMPPYPQLSEEQVQALARYVAHASGGAK